MNKAPDNLAALASSGYVGRQLPRSPKQAHSYSVQHRHHPQHNLSEDKDMHSNESSNCGFASGREHRVGPAIAANGLQRRSGIPMAKHSPGSLPNAATCHLEIPARGRNGRHLASSRSGMASKSFPPKGPPEGDAIGQGIPNQHAVNATKAADNGAAQTHANSHRVRPKQTRKPMFRQEPILVPRANHRRAPISSSQVEAGIRQQHEDLEDGAMSPLTPIGLRRSESISSVQAIAGMDDRRDSFNLDSATSRSSQVMHTQESHIGPREDDGYPLFAVSAQGSAPSSKPSARTSLSGYEKIVFTNPWTGATILSSDCGRSSGSGSTRSSDIPAAIIVLNSRSATPSSDSRMSRTTSEEAINCSAFLGGQSIDFYLQRDGPHQRNGSGSQPFDDLINSLSQAIERTKISKRQEEEPVRPNLRRYPTHIAKVLQRGEERALQAERENKETRVMERLMSDVALTVNALREVGQ